MAKHIIKNKVSTKDQQIFVVGKVAHSEETVYVDFGRKVRYRVVKLSIRDLPKRDTDGEQITWINNFGVKGPSGRYSKRVKYTVFLRDHPGKAFIYFDHRGLRHDKVPKRHGTRPPQPGLLQVDFYSGDPGTGLKKKT
jgi:hypothetical protein